MVDQQEFHHAFARGLDHFAVGADFLPVGSRQRTARLRLGRSGLHFDQAHAAVAGDGQTVVIAEARDFLAGLLAGLQDRHTGVDLVFRAVDGDLWHLAQAPSKPVYSAADRRAMLSRIRFSISGRKWRINP